MPWENNGDVAMSTYKTCQYNNSGKKTIKVALVILISFTGINIKHTDLK